MIDKTSKTKRRELITGRWQGLIIGAVGLGAGAILTGAVSMQNAPPEVAAVVIDTEKSSGRWGSTLIAVMNNGDIMYLDTTRPTSEWVPYMYSPSFTRK